MAHSATHLSACANCGYAFPPEGPAEFCPRCGQQNHEVNISFGHLVEETLEGLFHFDGKVFRTAQLLLFRPGVLTRRFLEGQRVPYVPPVRLYVFLSFVFFLLLSSLTKPKNGHERGMQQLTQQAARLTEEAEDSAAASRRAQSPAAVPDSVRRQLADSLRRRIRQGRLSDLKYGLNADSGRAAGGPRKSTFNVTLNGLGMGAAEVARLPADPSPAQVDSIIRSRGAVPSFWNRLSVQRAVRWRDVTREDAFHQALRGLSVLIFLLMPLAALLLKGAYFRQHRRYISHLIFTVHVHCFLFVYFGVVLLLSKLSVMEWAEDLWWVLPAIYFVVALRNFYQQGWGKTVLKSGLLGLSYSLTLGLAAIVVFIFGLMAF